MSATLLHGARLVEAGTTHPDAWLLLADGVVAARGAGDDWRLLEPPTGTRVLDVAGDVLAPGFVDVHSHGGGGHAHDDGADAIRAARRAHLRHGTTSAVISLVTAPIDLLLERVATVAALAEHDPTVLGSHLEGPFLDPGHHGAHDPALLRPASADTVDALLRAGRGTIRQVTIAPELPGAADAIARFTAAGVTVGVGHTAADASRARAAFDAGATLLTHAFNAMPGIHHRAPGPVVAALRDHRVTLEVIADGVHVDTELIAVLFAAAPGRIALVTDAMAAAAGRDGAYLLGELPVTVADGVARIDATGAIAGSTLTQDAALARVVALGVPLADAVAAVTSVPADAIGAAGVGRLTVGAPADVVRLRGDLTVGQVWSAGAPLHPEPPAHTA